MYSQLPRKIYWDPRYFVTLTKRLVPGTVQSREKTNGQVIFKSPGYHIK